MMTVVVIITVIITITIIIIIIINKNAYISRTPISLEED